MPALQATASVHGGLAPPWRTLLLTGLALALWLVAGPAPEAWVYDRTAIGGGEVWRLVTGHLVHSDAEHAFWDMAALALLGGLFEHRLGRSLVVSLGAGIVTIDAWLWWSLPKLALYCGLSGVINSLLAAGLWQLWRDHRDPLVVLVAMAALAKIGFEIFSGQPLFTSTAWPSVPVVHGVGFATGLAVGSMTPRARSPMDG
jgi:rhomboid family GlyGly-CTERM serine protease